MFSVLRRPAPEAPLSVADIAAQLARDEIVLLDVREMAEVQASGKAEGAMVIPLSLLGLKCDPSAPDCMLPAGKPVAIYCAAGGRAAMAAQTLARMGYVDLHPIGGLGDWIAAGGQVERI